MNKTLSRPVKFILVPLLILPLLAMATVGLLLGLASSEPGTRLLVAQFQRWSGGMVSWEAVQGSLLGPLQLDGLQVSQPGLSLDARSVALDWRPGELLRGTLQIDVLEATGMRIALSDTDPTAPAGEAFTPGALKSPVDISLGGVRLRDLQLVQGDQPAVEITQIDLNASLQQSELSLQHLALRLPQGSVALVGTTTLADAMPLSLQIAWDWRMPGPGVGSPAGGMPSGEIPLAGNLALQGQIDWRGAIEFDLHYQAGADGLDELSPDLPSRADISGTLRGRYHGEELDLGQLSIALAETPLELALRGQLSQLGASEPSINANLEWAGLQWPLAGNEPTVTSAQGKLHLAGTVNAYDLELAANLSGTDLPDSEWQGQGTGGPGQVRLHQLRGRLLGGDLSISGPLAWHPAPGWDLQVEGSNLDPGQLAPEFPGLLEIKAHITGQLDPDRGLTAELALEQLSGNLLGYPLNLNARAHLVEDAVAVHSLELDSGGNRLDANGAVSPESLALDWRLMAGEPGALLPGAAGRLTARGMLRGSPQSPRVQAQLQGEGLRLDALTITTVEARLEAGLAADDALQLDITAGPIQQGEQSLLQSLQLRGQGTMSRHRLDLALAAGSDQLQVSLEGGMAAELTAWEGQLARLIARSEQYSNWRLVKPAPLSLSATEVTLGNSCLQGEQDAGRLCAQVGWAQAGDSQFQVTLRDMRTEYWVPAITGAIDGEVAGSLASDDTLRADGSLHLTPGQVNVQLEQGSRQLAHGGGDLALTVDAGGLATRLRLATPEQGQVAADLRLPDFSALPLAEPQPLRGQLQAALPDLGGLAAWVPQLASTAGRLEADLELAGTLGQPELTGDLVLSDGAADIPMAGLQLRQITLRAVGDPAQPGRMVITGGMVSVPGRLELSGQLDLPGNTLDLELQGDRLTVFNTPDARALLSPDLQLGWRDGILRMRGDLIIPQADITPRLALGPAANAEDPQTSAGSDQPIAPSPDVIVLNAQQEAETDQPTQAPLRIDSQVQLVLGDQVDVRAVGLISRVTGAVTFINTPDQAELLPLADGRLSLEDGTFRAFGQNLDIETGQLIFARAPVTEAELNVRAFRWIDNDPEVAAAGVVVTGSVTEPALELVSRPQMEASEILSYLLTGRSAQDRETVLSIGTYLTPRVYAGYGYNLLEETSEFNSLFSITPRYGVGTDVGEADNNINMTITYER